MVKLTTKELEEQHKRMSFIISELQTLLTGLAFINKFLYESMAKSLLEKDEKGNYIQSEDKE